MRARSLVMSKLWWVIALAISGIVAVTTAAAAAPTGVAKKPPTCDPTYGCTTTTTAPILEIRCTPSVRSGPAGTNITLACEGIAPGTDIQVLWNSKDTAHGKTHGKNGIQPAAVGRAQAFDAASTSAAASVVSYFDYAAPGYAPATYDVVVAGTTFNAPAGAFTLTGGNVSPASTGSSGSSLAHTGLNALLWLLVALAVIAAGVLLNRFNRRRRYLD